jgi:glycerophosphoryl diester phosphodiesterase
LARGKPYLVNNRSRRYQTATATAKSPSTTVAVDGSSGVLERAHDKGLLVHTWTFRNDASGYGFAGPKEEMTYYFDLGVDGLFTDFADTGVEARNASINAKTESSSLGQCPHRHHELEQE